MGKLLLVQEHEAWYCLIVPFELWSDYIIHMQEYGHINYRVVIYWSLLRWMDEVGQGFLLMGKQKRIKETQVPAQINEF